MKTATVSFSLVLLSQKKNRGGSLPVSFLRRVLLRALPSLLLPPSSRAGGGGGGDDWDDGSATGGGLGIVCEGARRARRRLLLRRRELDTPGARPAREFPRARAPPLAPQAG